MDKNTSSLLWLYIRFSRCPADVRNQIYMYTSFYRKKLNHNACLADVIKPSHRWVSCLQHCLLLLGNSLSSLSVSLFRHHQGLRVLYFNLSVSIQHPRSRLYFLWGFSDKSLVCFCQPILSSPPQNYRSVAR